MGKRRGRVASDADCGAVSEVCRPGVLVFGAGRRLGGRKISGRRARREEDEEGKSSGHMCGGGRRDVCGTA